MSERETRNAQAKGTNETKGASSNSPKKFRKINLLHVLGLLSSKYNYETNEFERSWPLRLVFFCSLLSKPLFTCPFLISCFFEKTDVAQLYVGSVLNYLPQQPKFFIGVGVSVEMVIENGHR